MKFSSKINPVRLGEFDMGGVLYHARYFHIYEELREVFLKHLGFPYPELVEGGNHLVIQESSQTFHKPIKYGQELFAELKVVDLRKSHFSFEYKIFSNSESEVVVNRASTKHAFVKLNNNFEFKISKIPSDLYECLQNYT